MGLEIAVSPTCLTPQCFAMMYDGTQAAPGPVLKALERSDISKMAQTRNPHSHSGSSWSATAWDVVSAKHAERLLRDGANTTIPSGTSPAVAIIRTAGVTYGAFPKEAIEAEHPDYILDSISQVIALCGLEMKPCDLAGAAHETQTTGIAQQGNAGMAQQTRRRRHSTAHPAT